jgi:hypothetical protein
VKGNTYHYTAGVCDSTGKKTFSKTDECSIYNVNNGVAIYQEDCCYIGDWVPGECNVDDRPGYKKYTRTVPNAGSCSGYQLGEHEVGDPTVKYIRDWSACDKNCITGYDTSTDVDENGNMMIKCYGGEFGCCQQRKYTYHGAIPHEGLSKTNKCVTYEQNRGRYDGMVTMGNIRCGLDENGCFNTFKNGYKEIECP